MNDMERAKVVKNFQRGLLTEQELEWVLAGRPEQGKPESVLRLERERAAEQVPPKQPQAQGLTLEQKKLAKTLAGSVLLGLGLLLYVAWVILFILAPAWGWTLASWLGLAWGGLYCGNVAFRGFASIIDASNDIVDDIEG